MQREVALIGAALMAVATAIVNGVLDLGNTARTVATIAVIVLVSLGVRQKVTPTG